MSESSDRETQTSGLGLESTMARLVVSGAMIVAILAATAVAAVVARALAPDAGSLDGSPLAGFLAGVATAVSSGASILRRRQTPLDSDATRASGLVEAGLDEAGVIVSIGPAIGMLTVLVLVINWWEPSQAVAGIAAGAASGAIIVSLLGALSATRIGIRPLWLPVVAKPAWLHQVQSNAATTVVAVGFLVLAAIPVVSAAFEPDPLSSAAVAQLLIAVLIVAFGSGAVALRLGGDTALAVRLMSLRFLAAMAAAGIGLSLSGDDNQLAVVVVALSGLVALLADTEAVGAFDKALSPSRAPSPKPSHAPALAKLAIVVLSLVFVTSGGPGSAVGNRELALAMVLVSAFEFMAVDLVLRPLVVDQGPTLHRLARPWRAAWHGYTIGSSPRSGQAQVSAPSAAKEAVDAQKPIEDLVRREFRFLSGQRGVDAPDVFVEGVPAGAQASSYRAKLVAAGLRIEGGEPQVQQVTDVQGRNPVRARIVVDYPAQRLVDTAGRLQGRRPATRRSGMVWLVPSASGGYRIADSVAQGSEALEPVDLTAEPSQANPSERNELSEPRQLGPAMEEPSG